MDALVFRGLARNLQICIVQGRGVRAQTGTETEFRNYRGSDAQGGRVDQAVHPKRNSASERLRNREIAQLVEHQTINQVTDSSPASRSIEAPHHMCRSCTRAKARRSTSW